VIGPVPGFLRHRLQYSPKRCAAGTVCLSLWPRPIGLTSLGRPSKLAQRLKAESGVYRTLNGYPETSSIIGGSDLTGATILWAWLAALVGLSGPGVAQQQKGSFTLVPDEHGMVLKTHDGRTVLRYMTKKPAPSDHRHHRGVFLTWYTMEGKKAADVSHAELAVSM